MTIQGDQQGPRPALTAAEPQLFVADIKACDFFTHKLGFAVVFAYGDPPFYGQVMRDGARLNLRRVDAPVFDGASRERESLLSATMTLETADDIERVVRDPDGNLLLFAGPAD
jgi:hypothetical protein